MIELLGRPGSINVRKVLWTCAELHLAYRQVPWGTDAMPLDATEFRALNPNGMVPVLKDDGFVLWESNTICRYLAGSYGGEHLLPAEPKARARVEQWMDWQATELNNAWRYAYMGLVRRSPAHADPRTIAGSVQAWNRHMAILEEQLQRTGAYVAGASFTLADIGLGLSLNRWQMTPIERPDFPALSAWDQRLRARSGYREHGCNGAP